MVVPPSPQPAAGLMPGHLALLPPGTEGLEGVDEATWLDVIHKMDEVYSQLVRDEIALEEKNAELERCASWWAAPTPSCWAPPWWP